MVKIFNYDIIDGVFIRNSLLKYYLRNFAKKYIIYSVSVFRRIKNVLLFLCIYYRILFFLKVIFYL